MKAIYMSSSSRAMKIIIAVWIMAAVLSSPAAVFAVRYLEFSIFLYYLVN